ncbi:MAG: acyl carrier protein [Desulfobacterales bacterium]|nr:acyl carrier protein [Desulfobacterales bacterium]
MSQYTEILKQLFRIIKPFTKDGQSIGEDTDIVADLGLDSLQVMKLVNTVEDQFDIMIPLNILPDVRTVSDFANQLNKLIEEQQ